jgi:hypothetical protein
MQIHSGSSQPKIFLTEPEVKFTNPLFNEITDIISSTAKEGKKLILTFLQMKRKWEDIK